MVTGRCASCDRCEISVCSRGIAREVVLEMTINEQGMLYGAFEPHAQEQSSKNKARRAFHFCMEGQGQPGKLRKVHASYTGTEMERS